MSRSRRQMRPKSVRRKIFFLSRFYFIINFPTFGMLMYVIRPPMATREIVANITAQVHRLMEQHTREVELRERLKAENDVLCREKRALQERVRELEEELSRKLLAEGLGGGRNREQARMRVNRLMREVDKCIALLNRQQE